MDVISFVIDGDHFDLDRQQIPDGSLLHKMITTKLYVNKDENGCYILYYDKEDFIPIYEYLKNKKVPSYEDLDSFDYFGIDLNHSYELASVIEEDMRANMYKDECKELYKDNHHGLIKINENFWNGFEINKSSDKNLLFNTKNLVKSKWSTIQNKLDNLKKFTDIKGVFVAGGSIFSILFDLPINDIDLFLYGVTEDETTEIINKISRVMSLIDITDDKYKEKMNRIINKLENLDRIKSNDDITIINNTKFLLSNNCLTSEDIFHLSGMLGNYYSGLEIFNSNIIKSLDKLRRPQIKCTRTANAITFKSEFSEVQVILRLYQNPSEVLHGFDVDSCCLGFDGADIWMTQRACFALKNGYNTINFNRLSPSYELRLAKYGCRGMAIKINDFDINNINKNELADYFASKKNNNKTQFYSRHHHLSKLHNIDKLLYLDYYCEHYNYKNHSINMINKLNHEKSDYAAPSFIDYTKCSNGSGISDLMLYFYYTYAQYLEFDKETEEDGPVDFTENMDLIQQEEAQYICYSELIQQEKDERDRCKNLSRTSNFLKSEVDNCLKLLTNSIYNKFWFIKGDLKYLNLIINIPDLIYDALKLIQPWDFPARLKFKITNPGEQMTNTFHQIILEDNNQWFNGRFYKPV